LNLAITQLFATRQLIRYGTTHLFKKLIVRQN
jgi:hypothetical protein